MRKLQHCVIVVRKGQPPLEFVLTCGAGHARVRSPSDFGRFATRTSRPNAARAEPPYGMMKSVYVTQSPGQTAVQTAATNEMSQQTGFVSGQPERSRSRRTLTEQDCGECCHDQVNPFRHC